VPAVQTQAYFTIEDVFTLCRVHLNDSFPGLTDTPGEGLNFIDTAPFVLPILNDAIAEYVRQMHNNGVDILTKEVFLYAIPQVNGPLGQGVPDPTIQQNLSFNGFFDGALNYATPALPIDCLVPLKMWTRTNGTGLTFQKFTECQDGLKSRYQDFTLGEWDWRGDAIFWNGSLGVMDLRLRYLGTVQFFPSTTPPAQFNQTPVPLRDALTALAYLCAEKFAASRVQAGGTADLMAKAAKAIADVVNRQVRARQHRVHYRQPYGESGDVFGYW
jgi:hypothetical protein